MSVTDSNNPILIVDDDETVLLSIDTTLRMAGFDNITTCADSRKVMNILSDREIDLVLLDLTMPNIGGEDLLPSIRETVDIPVIIVTGAVDVNTAVRCIRAGAFDYIVKPVEEDHLVAAVTRALTFQELKKENLALRRHVVSDLSANLKHPEAFKGIVTGNRKMLVIFQYVESIAKTSQPALVTGETGVGKELMARALHTLSGLNGRFVAVNAAGLDDNMFSDTLFGHVKGAFTGADVARRGLIDLAKGGTLFLDEIGDLNPASQVKLLRLLQEGDYMPIGADHPKQAEVRVVAATNHDLSALQKEGRFRKDLNYRLNTHRIHIPPLRERMEDIHVLTEHFLEQTAAELGRKKPATPSQLFKLLQTYSFPGNIRELQSMVFDAVSRHESGALSLNVFISHIMREQTGEHAHETGKTGDAPVTFGETLPTLKQAAELLVDEAIRRANGNQTAAAKMLGITQQALSKRLRK